MRQLIENLQNAGALENEHISQSNLRHERRSHWLNCTHLRHHKRPEHSSRGFHFRESAVDWYPSAWIYGCRACDWWVFAVPVVPATQAKFNWIERHARIRVCVWGSMHRERRTHAVGLVDWVMVAWHGRLFSIALATDFARIHLYFHLFRFSGITFSLIRHRTWQNVIRANAHKHNYPNETSQFACAFAIVMEFCCCCCFS